VVTRARWPVDTISSGATVTSPIESH
jgi:hypothetical protein